MGRRGRQLGWGFALGQPARPSWLRLAPHWRAANGAELRAKHVSQLGAKLALPAPARTSEPARLIALALAAALCAGASLCAAAPTTDAVGVCSRATDDSLWLLLLLSSSGSSVQSGKFHWSRCCCCRLIAVAVVVVVFVVGFLCQSHCGRYSRCCCCCYRLRRSSL